jgi:hypothetical protein
LVGLTPVLRVAPFILEVWKICAFGAIEVDATLFGLFQTTKVVHEGVELFTFDIKNAAGAVLELLHVSDLFTYAWIPIFLQIIVAVSGSQSSSLDAHPYRGLIFLSVQE